MILISLILVTFISQVHVINTVDTLVQGTSHNIYIHFTLGINKASIYLSIYLCIESVSRGERNTQNLCFSKNGNITM